MELGAGVVFSVDLTPYDIFIFSMAVTQINKLIIKE